MCGSACAAVRHCFGAGAPSQVDDLGAIVRIWFTEMVVLPLGLRAEGGRPKGWPRVRVKRGAINASADMAIWSCMMSK